MHNFICTLKNKAEIIESTCGELEVLNSLGEEYKEYSEMSNQDRAFLNTLLLRKQPKKVLELGVSMGGSSVVILNAIKNIPGSKLYSCDYNEKHYRIKDKNTGFYVDNFPALKNNWKLFCGGFALNYLDEIGGDIDFCLIDTVHSNPGEILDILMVLPYLKKDALIVFHDTNLHTRRDVDVDISAKQITNNLLMSAVKGDKLIPGNKFNASAFGHYFPNIGAIQANDDTFNSAYEIFNLLTIRWSYLLNNTDIEQFSKFIQKYYGEYYVEYFKAVLERQELNFRAQEKRGLRLRIKDFCRKNFGR